MGARLSAFSQDPVRYARIVVWLTTLPARSIAVARNDTYPVVPGLTTVAVQLVPAPTVLAFYVKPSSVLIAAYRSSGPGVSDCESPLRALMAACGPFSAMDGERA